MVRVETRCYMKTATELPTKDSVARLLASDQFSIEPGLTHIFRLEGDDEDDPKEPIKLLEVNKTTVGTGIIPVQFGPHPASGIHYSSVIVEITPAEFRQLKEGILHLPFGWRLGGPYKRKKTDGRGRWKR
jgi:hypothetical protein